MTLHARPALLLWILLLFVSGGILANMTMTTDLTALLPRFADHRQELLVSQLRDGVAARLILIGLSGAETEALAQASRTVARKLRDDTEMFASVHNGDPADFTVVRDVLMRHRYLMSSAVAPEHFTPAALREALEQQLRLLASPAGALTKAALPADPTGEVTHILSAVAPGEGPSMRHGVWFSSDGARALLVAETSAPGFAMDEQEAAVKAVRTAFASSGLPESAGLVMTGPGVFAVESRATIERDAWRLSLIAVTIVTLLLFSVYRSVTPLLLAVAAMGWLARYMAALQGASEIRLEHASGALGIIDRAATRLPALGTWTERNRLSYLHGDDGLIRLVQRYRITSK